MPAQGTTSIRMFGALHGIRKDRGLPCEVELDLPAEGCAASSIVGRLDLPLEKVEGVFINNKMHTLDHLVQPGDRIAFVPTGVPGSRGLFCAHKNT